MTSANSSPPSEDIQLEPRRSVLRLVGIVATSIFVAETILMIIFDRLPRLPSFTGDLLDGILLTVLLSPILYLYLFRPMHEYIAALHQARGLLRKQRDHLEEEVQSRTAELVERNAQQERLVQDLKNAEEKYRNLVEHLPSITYIMALEDGGRLKFVSPQIEQLGFAEEDWVDLPDFHVGRIHPDDREQVRQAFLHSFETGEPFRCDYRMFTRDDEVRWFHDEGSVIHDESGNTSYLQGIMLDITDNKAMEEELAEHRYRLELRVERRTELMERRIAVLESANARLCGMLNEYQDKLRQARSACLPGSSEPSRLARRSE